MNVSVTEESNDHDTATTKEELDGVSCSLNLKVVLVLTYKTLYLKLIRTNTRKISTLAVTVKSQLDDQAIYVTRLST